MGAAHCVGFSPLRVTDIWKVILDRDLLNSKTDSTDIIGFCLPDPFLRNSLHRGACSQGFLYSTLERATAGQFLSAGSAGSKGHMIGRQGQA